MPRTRITTEEIENLLRFGKELEKRMNAAGLGFTDLARKTDGKVSVGYISDIVRAARGDSEKHFRLGRAKVAQIASALNWPELEALTIAGFRPQLSSDSTQRETVEGVLRYAFARDGRTLSDSEIVRLRPLMEVLDREIDRLLQDK